MADSPETKTLKVGRALTRAGISVIPTRPADKRPALASWKPFQSEIVDEDYLPAWFDHTNGLAIIGGAVSGNLLILDFDEPGLFEQFEQACKDHGIDALAECAVVQSPSGGNHVYLRSEDPVGASDKIAWQTFAIPTGSKITEKAGRNYASVGGKSYLCTDNHHYLKCVIETRGEGGYAVTFPTTGYKMLHGRTDALPVLDKASLAGLLAVAALFDTYKPPAVEPKAIAGQKAGKNTPGNDYNARGDYIEILKKHGWQLLHSSGGRTTWARPGKEEHENSATTGHAGMVGMYVFSSNAPPFDPGRIYRPFAVYSMLEHGGDFSAATKALVKDGYGEPATAKFVSPRAKKRTIASQEKDKLEAARNQGAQYEFAREWAKENKDRFIYLSGDQWFEYRDGYWRYSSAEKVQRSIQEYLAGVTSVNAALVGNVRTLAKSMVGPYDLTDFNANSNWIPMQNGVLDTVSGQLLPHSPENRVTNQTPYDYVPDADCPTWRRFLGETLITGDGKPCRDWHDAVQEWYGYCLIPDNTAQLSMMWVGEGGNGKGVATRVLEQLVGKPFATSIPIEQLHDPYHRAELYGKLVGFVNEPDPRAMMKNGNHFKAIVGGDSLSARRPTEKVFTFTPMTRLVISCNELPTSKDLSRGYYRRLLLIDWRYNVPADKRDPELDDKMKLELPGILNWALEGLARWRTRGRKFVVPEESGKLLEQYRMEQDNLRRYMSETCVYGPKAYVQNSVFYEGYRKFCEEYGEKPEAAKSIAARLGKMGFATGFEHDDSGGERKSFRVYRGLDTTKEKE